MRFSIIVLLSTILLSCTESSKLPYTLPANAKSILTGDTSKVWKLARRFNNKTRMNMGDCFISHRDTYHSDMKMKNNSGDFRDCGETLTAKWKFAKDQKGNYYIRLSSAQIPRLLGIKEDFKLFKILHLSENRLTLQYSHRQFSNKTTTITDILVPEHSEITDREFHW